MVAAVAKSKTHTHIQPYSLCCTFCSKWQHGEIGWKHLNVREYYLKLNYYMVELIAIKVLLPYTALILVSLLKIIAGMLLDSLTVDDIDGEAEGGEKPPHHLKVNLLKNGRRRRKRKKTRKKKRRRRTAATKELGGGVKAGREGEEEGGEGWGDMWKT